MYTVQLLIYSFVACSLEQKLILNIPILYILMAPLNNFHRSARRHLSCGYTVIIELSEVMFLHILLRCLYCACAVGKEFFARLTRLMSSGPFNPLILAHEESAVERWRELMGPTKRYCNCASFCSIQSYVCFLYFAVCTERLSI